MLVDQISYIVSHTFLSDIILNSDHPLVFDATVIILKYRYQLDKIKDKQISLIIDYIKMSSKFDNKF